jgi:hypothetical protein
MSVAECFGNLMGLLWITTLLKKAIMIQKLLKPKPTTRPFLFFFPATWLFFSFPFEEIYF